MKARGGKDLRSHMEQIWDDFRLPLKRFISSRISNQQDVEDVLHDVFFKIFSNLSTIFDDKKIHAWIYRITRNAIVDYYRNKKLIEIPDDLLNPEDEDLSINKAISECLKTMIETLPDKYKEAVILTEIQNLTQKELSEKIGLSLSGAKSRVQRGRNMLKTMLLNCCNIEFDRRGNIIDYQYKSSTCKYC